MTGVKDGGFVMAWQSVNGDNLGVFLRRFRGDNGSVVGGDINVHPATAISQSQPALAPFPDGGGFIAMWHDGGAPSEGIYAQAFKANGQRLESKFRVNSSDSNGQLQPAVAAWTGGRFIAVWTSIDQDGSSDGVYGQRFSMPSAAVAP